MVLKSKLTKGKVLKDEKGRELKVLNILDDGSLEIEVKTLSKSKDEKRGQARLKMYCPNKKGCSIQVTRSAGYSIVFVKALVEKFIQPIMNDPNEDPMKLYKIKTQEKLLVKNNICEQSEAEESKACCEIV